jgi:hypothetical protein
MQCLCIYIGWVRVHGGYAGKEKQAGQNYKNKKFCFHGIENSVNEALTTSTPLLWLVRRYFFINPASARCDTRVMRS